MTKRKTSDTLTAEHRKKKDRRGDDTGPPCGWRERRIAVERRLPHVEENAFSEAEWFRRMARYISSRRKAEEHAAQNSEGEQS